MPTADTIIYPSANLAVFITYLRETILSDVDTVECLNQAQNAIPPGDEATHPIPDPLITYRSGHVGLFLRPHSSSAMVWNEWGATVRALQWFREEYAALPMVFQVMHLVGGGEILGDGGLMVM